MANIRARIENKLHLTTFAFSTRRLARRPRQPRISLADDYRRAEHGVAVVHRGSDCADPSNVDMPVQFHFPKISCSLNDFTDSHTAIRSRTEYSRRRLDQYMYRALDYTRCNVGSMAVDNGYGQGYR